MGVEDQLAIAQLALGLAVVGVAVAYMYRRTRAAQCRELLFTLRDDLFDYMWKNGLSYDLPVYRLMRSFLNGSIRVVNEVTPLSFVVLLFMISRRMPDGNGLPAAIEAIEDVRTRHRFKRTLDECIQAVLVFLGPIGAIFRLAPQA